MIVFLLFATKPALWQQECATRRGPLKLRAFVLSGRASPSRRVWIEGVIAGQTVVSVFFLPNQKWDVNSMLQVRLSFKHKSSISCKSKLPKKSKEKKRIFNYELLVGLPPQPRLGGRVGGQNFYLVKCVFRPKKMADRIPSAEVHVHFCLLRSPDQKTEHVVVVVIHGTTFLYWKLLICERSF